MLKYLKLFFIAAFYLFISQFHLHAKNPVINLSEKAIISFYDYISSDRKSLDKFLVTEDGENTFTWICPQTLCFPASESFYVKPCSKLNSGKKCKIFASGRLIKWSNIDNVSINHRKIKQGSSLSEVKNKLRKLGFIN